MVASGLEGLPFINWDGIDGPGTDRGSFVYLAGRSAAGSYESHASIAPPKAGFVEDFARFGRDPDE